MPGEPIGLTRPIAWHSMPERLQFKQTAGDGYTMTLWNPPLVCWPRRFRVYILHFSRCTNRWGGRCSKVSQCRRTHGSNNNNRHYNGERNHISFVLVSEGVIFCLSMSRVCHWPFVLDLAKISLAGPWCKNDTDDLKLLSEVQRIMVGAYSATQNNDLSMILDVNLDSNQSHIPNWHYKVVVGWLLHRR